MTCFFPARKYLLAWLLGLSTLLGGALPVVRAETGQVLRLGIDAAAPETLDPHWAAATNDRLVTDLVYNGLIRYIPGHAPQFEPDLAVAIPEPYIVDGLQVWTFTLRRGVRFHPGPKTEAYELTADDVVYSFAKAADPSRSAYAGEYAGIRVTRVDDYTCRFVVDPPLSPILFFSKIADYAGGFIVSKRAAEAMGKQGLRRHPVGTGPFRFAGYAPGEKMRLSAHAGYFRGSPQLADIEIHYLPDAAERAAAFRRGQLDVIRGVGERDWLESVSNGPDTLLDIFGVPEVAAVHFNTRTPPLDDRRVRRAIAYALDREGFSAGFDPRTVATVYAPVPARYLPGGLTEEEVAALGLDYPTDLDRSRQLLAEAGYPEGFRLRVTASALSSIRSNYETLKKQLARVGIELEVEIVDHARWHRLIRQRPEPLTIYEAWRPNTDVFLSRFFHSDAAVVSGSRPDTNFSGYRQIDELIETARRERDPVKQVKLWKYAQVKLLEDMAVYPLHARNQVYVRQSDVDYGQPLVATLALYPQITEKTRLIR